MTDKFHMSPINYKENPLTGKLFFSTEGQLENSEVCKAFGCSTFTKAPHKVNSLTFSAAFLVNLINFKRRPVVNTQGLFNQISLAGPHTVELEQRENEQTRQRQLSDKAGREQVEVT